MAVIHNHRAASQSMKPASLRSKTTGFTAVELIVVMIIVGILAISGVSRFSSQNTFHERGFTDTVLSSLHYAHRLATSGGCHLRVQLAGGNLTVSQWPTCLPSNHSIATTAISHPQNTGSFVTPIPSGVTTTSLDIYFDGNGRPHTTSSETATTSVTSIAVGGRSISIEAETGYAY